MNTAIENIVIKSSTLKFSDPDFEHAYLQQHHRTTHPQVQLARLLAITILMALGPIGPYIFLTDFPTFAMARWFAVAITVYFLLTEWSGPKSVVRQEARKVINVVVLLAIFPVTAALVECSFFTIAFGVKTYVFSILAMSAYSTLSFAQLSIVLPVFSVAFLGAALHRNCYVLSETLITDVVVCMLATVLGPYIARVLESKTRKSYLTYASVEVERERSEDLLLNILPKPIADQLKENPTAIAQDFDNVTVLFADIVGFTRMADALDPDTVVTFLNGVFSLFDMIAEKHDLEKIKTIGDAYMVAGGIPTAHDNHAGAVMDMALEIRDFVETIETPTGNQLQMRIGIGSGPVIAGVIGVKKFVYDLWGDTVNTASRMESNGAPGKIQVTQSTHETLKDRYEFEARGEIEIKGKGMVPTWWCLGKL